MATAANPQIQTSTTTTMQASLQTQSGTEAQPQHTHSIQLVHGGLPHGLGLLTTVASLPPKYRSRYLSIKTKCEIPLDLSVKPPSPAPLTEQLPVAVAVSVPVPVPMPVVVPQIQPQIVRDVPIATAFAEVHSCEPTAAATAAVSLSPTPSPASSPIPTPTPTPTFLVVEEEVVVITEKPLTPPQSPAKRKFNELKATTETDNDMRPAKLSKVITKPQPAIATDCDATPAKPIKVSDSAPRTSKSIMMSAKPSRNKATRKLKFDEETSSPVSGTIIRPLEDITDGTVQYSNGDIDPKYNIVEITEETKAELAAIKNVIGDYVCKLCRIKFDDAFGLAQHRCACIVLLEYRCPECGKQFNCPANLASHRRWHKPKKETANASGASKKENRNTTNQQQQQQPSLTKKANELAHECEECGKKFKRQAYLRKHQQTHVKRGEAQSQPNPESTATATTTTLTASFQAAPYKSSSSSGSSSHSHEDEGVFVAGNASSHYDYEAEYLSDCSSSSSSAGYGRLQIVENGLTEEESIAAAALTNLRNCASVIQHTTLAH